MADQADNSVSIDVGNPTSDRTPWWDGKTSLTNLYYGTNGQPLYGYDSSGQQYLLPSTYKVPGAVEGAGRLVGMHPFPTTNSAIVAPNTTATSSKATQSAPTVIDPNDFVPDTAQSPKIAPNDFVPDASPNEATYKPKILAEAKAQGLSDTEAQYLLGMVKQESNFDPNAKGKADPNTGHQALGMFQQFPASAKDVGVEDQSKLVGDPDLQVKAGVAYWKQKLAKYNGNMDMAAMAYNQGDNPATWKPEYAAQARKNAGLPLSPQFHDLAGQIYQQQHAYSDPANVDAAPWNFVQDAANNATLSGTGRLNALAHTNDLQDYGSQRALQLAWQNQWEQDHPAASMASGALGFLVPDTAVGKGVMAGGRALGEASSVAKSVLRPLLGLTDEYQPIKSGFTSIPRAIGSGATLGAVNHLANTDSSLAGDAVLGGVGGAMAQPIASLVRGASSLGGNLARGLGWTSEGSVYDSVRKGLAKTLGSDAPALEPSKIPGVDYSLPEMLVGKNPDINAKFQDAARADPVALQNQIAQNNAARVGFYHDIMKTPQDLADAYAELNANNQAITRLMDSQPGKSNPHGLDLKKVDKYLKEAAKDTSSTPIRDYSSTVGELQDKLYKTVGRRAKPKATMGDLQDLTSPDDFEGQLEKGLTELTGEDKKKQLINDAKSIHGLRRAVKAELDFADKPGNFKDKNIKRVLTDVKNLLDEELEKVPGYKDLMEKNGDIQKKIAEMEFLHSKTMTNIQDILNPAALDRLIKEIERSHLVKGVLGPKAKAKSVLPETLEKLKLLRDDIKTSLAAKVPVNISSHAQEGEEKSPLGGLFHMAAGTTGAVAGGALLGTHGGPLGWMTGMIGQQFAKKFSGKAASRTSRATLDVMLHPHKYPPIAPTAPSAPPGFYSGMLGGNAMRGAFSTSKEKEDGE